MIVVAPWARPCSAVQCLTHHHQSRPGPGQQSTAITGARDQHWHKDTYLQIQAQELQLVR